MKIRIVIVLLLALFAFNCASIVHTTTQQVAVKSTPGGAAVTVSCGDVYNDPKLTTPAVVTLHRKPDYCAITLSKTGYADKVIKFGKQMSALYLGNILLGGIVGLIVDGANGAMWNRTPGGDVNAALEATPAQVKTGGGSPK